VNSPQLRKNFLYLRKADIHPTDILPKMLRHPLRFRADSDMRMSFASDFCDTQMPVFALHELALHFG
tara:strand:+ start:467 stop:667 length:201 start_codon:yes stop_codon:yes gene_type:complete